MLGYGNNSDKRGSTRSSLEKIDLSGQRPMPTLLVSTLGVFRYELSRTLTFARSFLWTGLVVFPASLLFATLFLTSLRSDQPGEDQIHLQVALLMFVLLPQVITVLCMLLLVVPIINAELEGHTWIYSVVRPGARRAMMLGKYFAAVLWIGTCTCCSTIACGLVASTFGVGELFKTCSVIILINWIAAVVYGALMMGLGTLFQRRSMVIAFAYAIGVEAVMGWIPAVINRFTISYRLRSLMMQWMDINLTQSKSEIDFLWERAMYTHLSVLGIVSILLVLFAIWRVERGQFRFQSEY